MKNILIFGGTFNPPHNGHFDLIRAFSEKISADKILIIPSSIPPHKSSDELIDSADRVNMCKLAFANIENAEISEIEIERKGKSFTSDTLHELSKQNKDCRLYFVTGSDMFLTLEKWHNFKDIFEKAVILTSPRNNEDYEKLIEYGKYLNEIYGLKYDVLNKPVLEISSTDVRKKIKLNEDVSDLISADVYRYIKNNNLYL